MTNKIKTGFLSAALLCGILFSNGFAQQLRLKPIKKSASISKRISTTISPTVNQSSATKVSGIPNSKHCASDELMKKYIAENHLEALYAQEKINKQNTSAVPDNDRTIKTIPVVFHVVYNPNIAASLAMNTKISTTVINNMIARLNADYSKTTTTGVRSAFQSLIANTNIQFCLANRDASGAVTTGIVRKTTTQTYFDDNSSSATNGADAMKTTANGSLGWDHLKYVNIWLCDITNNMALCTNGCTAGYAYLGATSPGGLPNIQNGIMIDGIVLDYNIGVFDVPGGSNLTISKSVSHEMGHYLGLEHTFADNSNACVNDDGFSDTPPIKGPFQNFYTCTSTTVQSCTNGTLWQYENLMDYSDCFVMFTTMQSNYMNNVLTNGRYGLTNWQATACAPAIPVTPVASFTGCNSSVSQNSTITFTNTSTNSPTTYTWSITPSAGVSYVNSTSSSSVNPQVTFANTGTYSVALTALNSAGSNTSTNASCIIVVAGNPGGCDTLLNITLDDTLAIYNSDNWGYLSGMNGYLDKAKAEKFLGSSYTAGNNALGVYIYFYQYSYANASSNINVRVWNATGAGGSPGASPLATKNVLLNTIPSTGTYAGFTYIPFTTPVVVSGDFFVGVEFSNPYVNGDTVGILTNRNGNTPTPGTAWEKYNTTWQTIDAGWSGTDVSLYIQPVLCSPSTSIEKPQDIDNINIYPNPSNGIISVMLGLNKDSDVKINVYNTLGQIVKSADMKSGYGGKVDFDLTGHNNGIYIVEIKTKSSVVTRRLILNK